MSGDPQQVEITFPRAGTWHDWTWNYDDELDDSANKTIDLPASGGKVWVAS